MFFRKSGNMIPLAIAPSAVLASLGASLVVKDIWPGRPGWWYVASGLIILVTCAFPLYGLYRLVNPFLIRVFAQSELSTRKEHVARQITCALLDSTGVEFSTNSEDLVEREAWKHFKSIRKSLRAVQ